jgi:hypothetical protein
MRACAVLQKQVDAAKIEKTPNQRDIYGDEIRKLDQVITAQQAYIAVIGGEPAKIQEVASAERAEGIIVGINNTLLSQRRALLTDDQQSEVKRRVALVDSLKAIDEYGKDLVGQAHAAELATKQQQNLGDAVSRGEEAVRAAVVENAVLSATYGKTAEQLRVMAPLIERLRAQKDQETRTTAITQFRTDVSQQRSSTDLGAQQAEAMAKAVLDGDEAIRKTSIDNEILARTYGHTAEEVKALEPELQQVRELLTAKSNAELTESINRDVMGMRDEIAGRHLVIAATTQYTEVLRSAEMAARLLHIEEQISQTTDESVKRSLESKKQAIVELTRAEFAEADAQDARSLRSTIEKFDEEIRSIDRAAEALKKSNGGNLSYGQSAQIAARAQDAFNRAVDDTTDILLRFGGLGDGVHAFFLQMQKDAETTGSIIYHALTSALDKGSDQIANFLTGQKTDFAKMMQEIGRDMVRDTVRSALQKGLGAVGAKLGVNIGGALGNKPDGTASNPIWVRMLGLAGIGGGTPAPVPGVPGLPGAPGAIGQGGIFSGAEPGNPTVMHLKEQDTAGFLGNALSKIEGIFGIRPKGTTGDPVNTIVLNQPLPQRAGSGSGDGIGALLGMLLGGGGGESAGAIESVSSTISYGGAFAQGGEVGPNKFHLVGEKGPELFIPKVAGTIVPNRKMAEVLAGRQESLSADTARWADLYRHRPPIWWEKAGRNCSWVRRDGLRTRRYRLARHVGHSCITNTTLMPGALMRHWWSEGSFRPSAQHTQTPS